MSGGNPFGLSGRVLELAERAERDIAAQLAKADAVSQENTAKVLAAFRANRVSDSLFAGTTGYGYDDAGRDTLDRVYAAVFHTEDALVRIQMVNGTHAIGASLFGILRPGDRLLYAVGAPYDTIRTTIGISGDAPGSLRDWGVDYAQVELTPEGTPDEAAIAQAAAAPAVRAVVIQRSPGYSDRACLSVAQIGRLCQVIHGANPRAAVLVDNCYGEFIETTEPTDVGADLVMGSLIKNPGGGLAPMGGYVAGRRDLVEAVAARATVPGIGRECGATLGHSRSLYQGLFLAPHVAAQARKTAVFCARMMELLGYEAFPASDAERSDIIQTIRFGNGDALQKFCRGIQSGAPVDAFVTPEPWPMPGYDCPVIMAAGAFIQGASIELSCDGPMREPYTAYLQGGLTYESGKLGILLAVEALLNE